MWSMFDVLIFSVGLYLCYRYYVWTPQGAWVGFAWWQTWLVEAPAMVVAGLIFGLYEQRTLLRRSRILARSMLTTITAITITYVIIYLLLRIGHSRRVLLIPGLFYLGIAPSIRLLVGSCINS